LRLDDDPSWVIVSDRNVDEWPNAGVTPLPHRPKRFSYGSPGGGLRDSASRI